MNESYTPCKDDFEFLTDRNIEVDKNFASQGYWKGVALHFFKNKFAMTGVVLVTAIIFLAIFGPIFNEYDYDDIISITVNDKQIVAKSLSPQFAGNAENFFADKTFLFGTDDMGRDLWTRVWEGARVSLIIAFVT
ncbi:MAG: hypothetical protein IKZ58_10560, partial [Selenomonadaceae bacterium]|nr:hypothetical protein [Selenomonadaceae bacterium]